jgi:DNA invertase Pin-like site-specific DNA recombinase
MSSIKRAVGIVRVSQTSGRESESFISPDIQRERIEQACEQRGLKLVKVYSEMDISGGADLAKRPGLSQAVAAVEHGEAEVVAAAYFDRLFRSLKTQAEVGERIEAAGGELLALDSGTISNGTAGEWLSATMLGAVSEYYRRQAKERSRQSADKLVKDGKANRTPFGYRWNGVYSDGVLVSKRDSKRHAKTLVIDPETAPYVERIFQMRADQRSWADIARWLADEGIKPARGGSDVWAISTLRNIISNETYIGVLTYGDRRVEGEDQCPPAIVSRGLFTAAPGVRTVQRNGRNAAGIAGGLLHCASCGAPLAVTGTNPSYTCSRVRNTECTRRTYVSKSRTDEWLEGLMIDVLRDGKLDVLVASRNLDALRRSLDDAREELKSYVVNASALDAELFKIGLAAREEKVKAAQVAYDDALAAAELGADIPDASGWAALSLDGRRRVARSLIERIIVHPPASRSPKLDVADRFEVIWRGGEEPTSL